MRLDGSGIERGIAPCVVLALVRGDQCAGAVGLEAPAFEHEGDPLARRSAEDAGLVQARAQGIVQRSLELAAPAVEHEIEQVRRSSVMNGDGAVIPRPGIVGGGDHGAYTSHVNARCLQQ